MMADDYEVWPAVIQDVESAAGGSEALPLYWRRKLAEVMRRRHAQGIAQYGVPLKVSTAVFPLEEALNEALDGCAYSRMQYARTMDPYDWETYRQFLALAGRILWRMSSAVEDREASK